MRPYRDSKITLIALSLFFIVLMGYALFEARGILMGPEIIVPEAVLNIHEPSVSIRGTTKHISALSMNGTPVPVTEAGAFAEMYIASEGYNRVVFQAKDKYGHTQEQVVEIVYTPSTLSSDQPSISSLALAAMSRRATTSAKTGPTSAEHTSVLEADTLDTTVSEVSETASTTEATETTIDSSQSSSTQIQ